MGQLKLGATKKSKRKATSTSNNATKKIKVDAKPAVKLKPQKPRNKGIKRTTVDIVRNDERDLSDQDYDDFDEYKHFQGFLQNLDPAALAQKVQKQERAKAQPVKQVKPAAFDEDDSEGLSSVDDDDLEDLNTGSEHDTYESDIVSDDEIDDQSVASTSSENDIDYELQTRTFKGPIESNRLPIKLKDGSIQVPKIKPAAPIIREEEVKVEKVEPVIPELEEPVRSSSDKLRHTQERLARYAQETIEDPEENIEQLGKIRDIYTKGNKIEKHYAILTMTAVFVDIIPGYRIRPLTDVEKAEKVTKEIKRLRNFEQTLISQYNEYIKTITTLTKTSRKAEVTNEYKDVAITAACTLLSSAPHFNFRIELVNILANQLTRKTVDPVFVKCRSTLENLFAEDQEGEASFEAMRILCKKLKDREYQVDRSAINLFLHLRLLTEMSDRGSTRKIDKQVKKKDRQYRSKKLRKLMKEQKEVENDLREAEASVNIETRERLQGETLKLVFTTYFRILKSKNRSIIGSALEGLARFAHLINVDFFGDLLEVLKELMLESDELSTRDTLLCIITAFTLLSNQGGKNSLTLDLSLFIDRLYAILLDVSLFADIEATEGGREGAKVDVNTQSEMLLRAIDAILFGQRVDGVQRLSAFTKRLFTISLHFPEKTTLGIVELIRRLLTRYGKVASLLNTDDRRGDGRYDPFANLDQVNPGTTSIYELEVLRRHYATPIRDSIQGILDQ